MITKINPTIPIVDKDGYAGRQLRDFFLEVERESLIVGTGSPEGVVSAGIGSEYMDDAGIASAIKYIKRDADIAGDRSKGWILV